MPRVKTTGMMSDTGGRSPPVYISVRYVTAVIVTSTGKLRTCYKNLYIRIWRRQIGITLKRHQDACPERHRHALLVTLSPLQSSIKTSSLAVPIRLESGRIGATSMAHLLWILLQWHM